MNTIADGGKQDTVGHEILKEFEESPQKIRYNRVQRNSEVRVEFNRREITFYALLDSGAFRSAINIKLKPARTEVVALRSSIRVVSAGDSEYKVREVGYMKETKMLLDASIYLLLNVYAMILDVRKWDDIIIGNDVLKQHRLDPASSLREKFRSTRVGVKPVAEYAVLVDWFVKEVTDMPVVTKMVEEEEDLPGYYERWREKTHDYEVVAMIEKKEMEVMQDEPVALDADNNEDEEFDADGLIDVGANLKVDDVEDRKRMAEKLFNMVNTLDSEIIGNSLQWKTRFTQLFKQNGGSFGDSDSPTVLSSMPPIECHVQEGKIVGVLSHHPLGFEQEKFLDKRLKQMMKAGIIRLNKTLLPQ
eukprot:augustus_masked-scaffold_11-processed-gene-10.54-mRNA-1 protein AED:1.00 eAED:1.00 QI:0/0/0/0/1/1/2/0/359